VVQLRNPRFAIVPETNLFDDGSDVLNVARSSVEYFTFWIAAVVREWVVAPSVLLFCRCGSDRLEWCYPWIWTLLVNWIGTLLDHWT
jgi:hypothetical protein